VERALTHRSFSLGHDIVIRENEDRRARSSTQNRREPGSAKEALECGLGETTKGRS
jgi:hypothetical protein